MIHNGDVHTCRCFTRLYEEPIEDRCSRSNQGHEIGVAPQETWTMQPEFSGQIYPSRTNVIVCKLQVFYGADKPAEAKFVIKFK